LELKDLQSCLQVNVAMNRLAKDDGLWKHICKERWKDKEYYFIEESDLENITWRIHKLGPIERGKKSWYYHYIDGEKYKGNFETQ
jgi:hypothetical protein